MPPPEELQAAVRDGCVVPGLGRAPASSGRSCMQGGQVGPRPTQCYTHDFPELCGVVSWHPSSCFMNRFRLSTSTLEKRVWSQKVYQRMYGARWVDGLVPRRDLQEFVFNRAGGKGEKAAKIRPKGRSKQQQKQQHPQDGGFFKFVFFSSSLRDFIDRNFLAIIISFTIATTHT